MMALYQFTTGPRIYQVIRKMTNNACKVCPASWGHSSNLRCFSLQGPLRSNQGDMKKDVNYSFRAGPWGTIQINISAIDNIVIKPLNAQQYPLQNLVFMDFFDAQGGKLENEVIEKSVKSFIKNDVVVIENTPVLDPCSDSISSCHIQLPLKIGKHLVFSSPVPMHSGRI